MTRTFGHKGRTDSVRRENRCPWVLHGYDYVEYGYNANKYHYIERQHYVCTKAEVSEMCERLDARAMDKEWTRMQIETEQTTE